MDIAFRGEIVSWRGPAPHHFVAVPAHLVPEISDVAARLTYGWGVVPVTGRIGATTFTTSLFPRQGGYLVPLKLAVRRSEHLDLGDLVEVQLTF